MHWLLERQPTKVAFAGDWHGNADYAAGRVMSAAAHGADVLVHVGDFGFWHGHGGATYIASLEKVAARVGLPIMWIDGNHEDFDELEQLPVIDGLRPITDHIVHAPRGARWEWGGLQWGALGGATSVDRPMRAEGVDWWPQEALTRSDVARWQAGGPVDVAITHDCPDGVTVPGITRERGVQLWGEEAIDVADAHRRLLADALIPTAPALLVHGHFHTYHQTRWAYPGGQAWVIGLDCDGVRPDRNTRLLGMDEIRDLVRREREHTTEGRSCTPPRGFPAAGGRATDHQR